MAPRRAARAGARRLRRPRSSSCSASPASPSTSAAQVAERRHAQTAADAGALAACRALIAGETDTAAATAAQQVTLTNLQSSPAGATAVDRLAAVLRGPRRQRRGRRGRARQRDRRGRHDGARRRRLDGRHDARPVVGVPTLDTGARARCDLQGGPAVPIVARRYANPPGPGSGFVDHLATAATSDVGRRSTPSNPRGYDVRTPASEAAPGPQFTIYGPSSKAAQRLELPRLRRARRPELRGHSTAASTTTASRPGRTRTPSRTCEGAYLVTGYPGPGRSRRSRRRRTGATQVAVLSGNSTSFVVQPVRRHVPGRRPAHARASTTAR